ncbi:flagellar basal body rod protein FlgB, partial [mine drainage metagenome]
MQALGQGRAVTSSTSTRHCVDRQPRPPLLATTRGRRTGNALPHPCDARHTRNRRYGADRRQSPLIPRWHASCCIPGRFNDRRILDMPLNLDAYLGVQPDALRVFAQRAQVLAANMANADTPGYEARDINFRAALAALDPPGGAQSAASGGGTLTMLTTSPRDVTAAAGP